MRHRKATMLCHQTKDILYVMKFLGHKNIKNTLIYTDLIEFGAEEEYHIKVAKTLKEACELAKAGFEYFTEIDGARSSENAHAHARMKCLLKIPNLNEKVFSCVSQHNKQN